MIQKLIGYMSRSLGDDFESPLNCQPQQPILLEIDQRFAGRMSLDAFDGLADFSQDRSDFPLYHQKMRIADCSMSARNIG